LIIIHVVVDNHPRMVPRFIADAAQDALSDTPAVLINGARQTGKSTLVQSPPLIKRGRQYLTFDDPGVLAAAKGDPAGFIAGLNNPVTLDEVQHVPELFPAMKMAIDRNRQPGRFLLTGSANVMLLPKIAESLAGRIEILNLWPFSQGEIRSAKEGFIDHLFSRRGGWKAGKTRVSRDELLENILAGGYPLALERKASARRKAWFQSYISAILQRDVRDITNVTDLSALPRLLSVVAARAGGLLNFADLSRSLGLPQTTLKRYFALLEATFLVQLLAPWSRNLGQRVIQTPKVYLNDTGLLAHLLGLTIDRFRSEETSLAGCLFENFVLMELRKQSAWSETRPEFYFWRTASGQEVDIVLENSAGNLVGLEVKASSTLSGNDIRGLRAFAEAAGSKWIRGVVLYTGSEVIPFGKNLHGIPLSHLWQTPKP
jgi:predicted AAA+ superfamily ATPase